MTATDELRRLLDERGVEWQDEGYPTTNTTWAADGVVWRGLFRDGCIELVAQLTPEQAVEATLGKGECREVEDEFGYATCSECGAVLLEDYTVYYCWNCGRKVVDA